MYNENGMSLKWRLENSEYFVLKVHCGKKCELTD